MNAIETHHVYKSFEGLEVLRGVNLRVPAGTSYGLIGSNGVGKSTLMRLLLGFLRPDQGVVRVLGSSDPQRILGRVGYLPERLRYHLRYTGREYLRYLGQFNGVREPQLSARINDELRFFDLTSAADRRLDTYSKGMLQRLGIAQAMLADPELVLIDEPTSGLDPSGQREMLDLLAGVRQRGHTILLTTHMLHEIEHACNVVGILSGGVIAFETNVAALQQLGQNIAINVPPLPDAFVARLRQISPAVRYVGREITIEPNSLTLQTRVLRFLLDANVPIISLFPLRRPLEDIFMRVISGETVELPAPPELPQATGVSNGMFAPPGHPDATAHQQQASAPANDDLLQALLQHEKHDEA
jgi:ABC-2 type transport system ATP-binding protein